MPFVISDDLSIAYESYGEGQPLLLIHGFASNGRVNWVDTGWVDQLVKAGYRVVTMDNRGHGQSEKPLERELYSARSMARDAIALIKALELENVGVIGYSMGARISTFVALDAPDRVGALVLGGMGMNLITGMRNSEQIAAGLLAEHLSDIKDPTGRQFRVFAEHTKSTLKALAVCIRASRNPISEDDVRRIKAPVLVAVGSEDEPASGDPTGLAALFPHGEPLVIPGRDHMRATGDKVFKQGALAFLERVLRPKGIA